MTMADRLETLLRSRPGEWIDGRELAEVAGCYAWRTRVTDVRRRGLRIDNRQRRVQTPKGQFTISEYRYLPADLIAIAEADYGKNTGSEGVSSDDREATC